MQKATARAHPNIAFIKYWGNRDDNLRLPSNPSLSMNLAGVYTQTTVEWTDDLMSDTLDINGDPAAEDARMRVNNHLDRVRSRLNMTTRARVQSENNFPMGAGIASSAAAFAALTVAAVTAADVALSERELTTIARMGSGSASRSVPGGFVEWFAADTHEES
ncbi:MAG: diphosphomevalonate decarboxylase, partial [Anaerolineae bacterium]|nr:diphosphomevalonate decarboxylase [Anaerolineae bacterium]